MKRVLLLLVAGILLSGTGGAWAESWEDRRSDLEWQQYNQQMENQQREYDQRRLEKQQREMEDRMERMQRDQEERWQREEIQRSIERDQWRYGR